MQRMWSTYLETTANTSHDDEPVLSSHRLRMMDTLHRRASSNMSHANSLASSQQHILRDHERLPPIQTLGVTLPSPNGSYRTPSPIAIPEADRDRGNGVSTSLSVNFLPSKFTRPVSPGLHKRKSGKDSKEVLGLPKRGGGREAFRSGEARMPSENDEDYDGVDVKNVRQTIFGLTAFRKAGLRWNRFKWILFAANCALSAYSIVALIFCLLTWFNIWTHADVVRVGNRPELVISTFAACMGIVTSLIGWAGILLNNRAFLSVFNLLLWITFAMICAPGYMTYKRRMFNLEGKINAQWSRSLGVQGRLRVQNELDCCGYFSPFVEATTSQTCYARSMLPGCKNGYLKFESKVLMRWYTVAFTIVPAHIAVMVAALLCSNHVTYRFGKGMMPKAYRLSMNSMAVLMDNYANQLVEQYGTEMANELMARTRSNFASANASQLDNIAPLPYSAQPGGETPPPAFSTAPGELYTEPYLPLDKSAPDAYGNKI